MEKHFLISESEKNRILNLHRNLLNEHGTMTEATTAVDKLTAKQAIVDFLGEDVVDGFIETDLDVKRFILKDGSGNRIPINDYNADQIKEGILNLTVKKSKVFDIKDAKKMTLIVRNLILPNLKLRGGYVMMCRKSGTGCRASFIIPTPKGLPSSNIPNKRKKLLVNVMFYGSQWDDDANAQINGKA